MTVQLTLRSDQLLEFAFGKVTPGKEQWMFGEYFPKASPIFADYGNERLGGFVIFAHNYDGVAPDSGAWTAWPSAKLRADLHEDARFAPMIPERDAAMDILSDGHLFETMDEVITLNGDQDYAVILTKETDLVSDPIFALPWIAGSASEEFAGCRLHLRPWGAADDALLAGAPSEALVFKIRAQ